MNSLSAAPNYPKIKLQTTTTEIVSSIPSRNSNLGYVPNVFASFVCVVRDIVSLRVRASTFGANRIAAVTGCIWNRPMPVFVVAAEISDREQESTPFLLTSSRICLHPILSRVRQPIADVDQALLVRCAPYRKSRVRVHQQIAQRIHALEQIFYVSHGCLKIRESY